MLENLKIAKFKFEISSKEKLFLPEYKGSTFRGGFGHAFKKVVCIKQEKICESCLLKEKCVYSYVFETPPRADTKIMRKYPHVPHPFIIEPPLEKRLEYNKGERLAFGLTLVGKSIDYLPYFIYALDELGRLGVGKGRGKYQLEVVRGILEDGNESENNIVYTGEDETLTNRYHTTSFGEIKKESDGCRRKNKIKLEFITPTRIKYDTKLVSNLEFHIFVRNLLRRISTISYFHCDEELDLDFKQLIEKSKAVTVEESNLKWQDWQRYSNRQSTRMCLGGFSGEITFSGDLKEHLPFILLGEYIHVGKGTSFGLGKYRVSWD